MITAAQSHCGIAPIAASTEAIKSAALWYLCSDVILLRRAQIQWSQGKRSGLYGGEGFEGLQLLGGNFGHSQHDVPVHCHAAEPRNDDAEHAFFSWPPSVVP